MTRSSLGAVFAQLAFAAMVAGCATDVVSVSGLATAENMDAPMRTLIRKVVADIRLRQYTFSDQDRELALETIGRLRASEYVADLREIAAMEVSTSPEHQWSDIVAISAALDSLTVLREDSATRLNTARLGSDDLRALAVRNLMELEAWDATPAVEAELLQMPMIIGTGHQVLAMLKYLERSPQRSRASCHGVQRVRREYPTCFDYRSVDQLSFGVELMSVTVTIEESCRAID